VTSLLDDSCIGHAADLARSDAHAVEEVELPSWAQRYSKPSTPEARRSSTLAARSPGEQVPRRLRSPAYHSPPPRGSPSPSPASPRGTPGSRSPSLPPYGSRALTAPGAASASGGAGVEFTCHSERLALGVYVLARHALQLLVALAPAREPGEAKESLDADLWPEAATLLGLLRQCVVVSDELSVRSGSRLFNAPDAR
jgi:hypothetical protein